jgi:hypothetical protein
MKTERKADIEKTKAEPGADIEKAETSLLTA